MPEFTDKAISEMLEIVPPISDENPVTPMQAETLLELAGQHFEKAIAALSGAARDQRFQSPEMTMLITGMRDSGSQLIGTADNARQVRQDAEQK
jgi:hypothetical protein